MTSAHLKRLIAVCLLTGALALAGCTDPDAPNTIQRTRSTPAPQNEGEPPAPAPVTAAAQAPTDVQRTPAAALAAFSRLYSNWTYRTLTTNQRTLAAMSVGPARLAEQQATASSHADTTITRGHIWNHAQIITIANDLTDPGTWVIVTREQTGGSSQYEELPASFHVTLARLTNLPGGYAVSEWLPQN
jgi:hypothetical protein